MLDEFFLFGAVAPAERLTGTYDQPLVALSVFIAMLSSALAFYIAEFAIASRERISRFVGIGTSGIVMGTGVWMMHFIGMLSLQLCVAVSYDPTITALSLLPALGAAWLALSRLSAQDSALRMGINGALIGAGIGLMHYGGMAAMVMAPRLRYDPALFLLSLVVAIGLAVASLFVRQALRARLSRMRWLSNVVGGAVLGLAISGMHYVAIVATRFIGVEEPGSEVLRDATVSAVVLTMSKVLVGLVVLVVVINLALRYRDLYLRSKALAEREAQLRERADAGKLQAEAAKDKAELLASMRSEFLSNMSHEIRTPMHGIMGLIGEIQRQDLTPRTRELTGLLDGVTRNMLQLLNDILDHSKLEGGQFQLQPRHYTLAHELERVSASFSATASDKGLTLITDVPPDLQVTLDPVRVNQIVSNLMGNAIKFTERGHVRLTVTETQHPHSGRGIRIQVQDSGVGMAPAVCEKIFDKYYQVVDGPIHYVSGTGLGLSICKELTALMRGSIGVESAPGRGTTFTVEIPCDAATGAPAEPTPVAAEADPAPPAAAPTVTPALRVLAADDNSINRTLLKAYLQGTDHELTLVEDGQQALDAARRGDFDVVLLDIGMPRLNGPDTMRALRALGGAWAHRPCIALTANARDEDKQEYLGMGFDGYVSKPFSREALMAELARVVPAGAPQPAAAPRTQAMVHEDGNHLEVLMDNFSSFSPPDLQRFIISAADQLQLNLSITRERLALQDAQGMQGALHCIAGSAPVIGCTRLGQAASLAMNHLRGNGPWEESRQLAQRCLDLGERSVQWLRQLARGM